MATRERRFTIGRDKSCDIPVADDSVSRLHAQLSLLDRGMLFLTDCNSSNGTFLMRQGRLQKVRQEFVRPEDEVRFGDAMFSVEDLLAVVRQKHAIPRSEEMSHTAGEAPAADPPPRGARLVRCDCGSVKVKGERCRMCGN